MKKIIVVFSDFNFRAIIAFIRTLEIENIEYTIIAKSIDDKIFKTSYANKVVYIRKSINLNLDDLLCGLKKIKEHYIYDDCMIAPSTEALNRFYLNHKNEFNKINCFMPIIERNLYEIISDKLSFCNLCKKYDIEIPNEYLSPDESNLPIVAKPKKYFSSDNLNHIPHILTDKESLIIFKEKYNHDDFYYQEYIPGRCIYLLYYIDKNKNVFKISQENFIQQENGKSMIYATISDFHNHEISRKFEKLFIEEGFRGLVMVELKINQDKIIMIEANPRFWGPSQLFVDANFNLFNCLLFDYRYINKEEDAKKIQKNTIYFWNDGIFNNIEYRKEISFYNYSKDNFIKNKDKLIEQEIFNRDDTIKIFKDNICKK